MITILGPSSAIAEGRFQPSLILATSESADPVDCCPQSRCGI